MESPGRCPRGLERPSAHDEPLTPPRSHGQPVRTWRRRLSASCHFGERQCLARGIASCLVVKNLLRSATLATCARHDQTNEPIPASLVHQMRRANELGRRYDIRQHMVCAKLSLSLHEREPTSADAMTIYKDLMVQYLPTSYPDGPELLLRRSSGAGTRVVTRAIARRAARRGQARTARK